MTDEVKIKVGNKLRELRGDRTLKKVAKDIGITAAALSNYENALRFPSDEIKVKIANYYKKSVQSIFFAD